ncbi:MAG TPA: DUF308 domain-containing protein [Pseudorhodoplanes sp.]|nr:DUF308 domain-containing protein [Pseudorhodoplanes sp.]
MSFVLFVLGVAAAAAGVLMIGFGIPINEFSLGNTLIIAGTTALASGLVVIGLSVVARQLSKIADLLLSRPAGPASGRSSDMLEQGGGGGRMPAPRSAHPADAAPPRAPAPSPSYDPAPGYDPIEDLPPPPPAPRPRLPGFGAPPAPPSAPAAAADPNAGKRGWRPPGTRPAATPPVEPPARQEPSLGVPERTARPAQEPSFDAIWPADRRAERIEPQQDLPPEPATPPLAPRLNGDATHREPPPARPAAENVPVSVLKSGVVDGMAYTLYTDGSIEAELAQGVVRFGSIEELRNHLEKGA